MAGRRYGCTYFHLPLGSEIRSPIDCDNGSRKQFESAPFGNITRVLGIIRIRTTAYHPISSGMVETFHRQVKASLTATSSHSWVEALPLVLLGIRSALKADIGCCSAELVYGTTLRLPGEFVADSKNANAQANSKYALRLQDIMSKLRPVPPRLPAPWPAHVPSDRSSCSHVFVKHDSLQRLPKPPYEGPFKVVKRGEKHITIAGGGRHDAVSLDRVKPGHVGSSEVRAPARVPKPERLPAHQIAPAQLIVERFTWSGRRTRPPVRMNL
ncbi:uncharacterized protein LOC119405855 [Rhipicephalus sanguineus]|uniref:uncharacterized protein LOC119405855 n=1 Tax=Rhipicephalus sanguineus TaxID=34632 RepID=UPI0018930216|nr:uncharacterized protein LOC119405855 [Rhipicephalus sanguineus]